MPSKNTARKPSGRNQSRPPAAIDRAAQTVTTPADAGTPALPPTAPDTAATRALWAALTAKPGATGVELAEAAGVSRSTANKTLALLAQAGLAARTPGGREGSKRLADTWQPVADQAIPGQSAAEGVQPSPATEESEPTVKQAESGPIADETDTKPAEEAETGSKDDGSKGRLSPGKLREMVLNHLRAHSDQDFTPSSMGKLMVRSSGAIANACDSLLAHGLITRTSEKPRRYSVAASSD